MSCSLQYLLIFLMNQCYGIYYEAIMFIDMAICHANLFSKKAIILPNDDPNNKFTIHIIKIVCKCVSVYY